MGELEEKIKGGQKKLLDKNIYFLIAIHTYSYIKNEDSINYYDINVENLS